MTPSAESLGGAATSAHPPLAALRMALLGVVFVAVLVRWAGYTGFFGSDGITYVIAAFKPLDGDWRVDDYVGANRLGVNLPMAAFAAVFGRNEFGAAAFSLACSVAEAALITWFGARHFGLRVGLVAGLLMATLPTHVYFAGLMVADAPLALTITASFALFAEAERRQWAMGYFLAGVAAGLSFWIKPVTQFIYGAFLFYPLVARRFDPRWLWMIPGMVLSLAANGLAFKLLTGRFWYVLESVGQRRASGHLTAGIGAGTIATEPAYYLEYLFAKIYHTGLLGYLALFGVLWLLLRRRELPTGVLHGARFVLFWAIGLMLLMSLMPARLNPLVLVPKQTNYMLVFAAPLCLLAAMAMARLSSPWSGLVLGAAMSVGVVFALLLQANASVFTANSWSTLAHVRLHADRTFHVMSNAIQAGKFESLLHGRDVQPRLRHVKDLARSPAGEDRYVVIDPETFSWDSDRPFARPGDVPPCWQPTDTLQGQPRGLGVALLGAVHRLLQAVPSLAASGIGRRVSSLSQPRPAQVYRVPAGC